MSYDKKYIDIKVSLINTFLLEASEEVLDVSYSVANNQITIQIVLIQGENLSQLIKEKTLKYLREFEVIFVLLSISKEKFNANKGSWNPSEYTWLDNLLFAKAESI